MDAGRHRPPRGIAPGNAGAFHRPACHTVVTGVGGTNIIHALKGLPTDSEVINVGFCGSADYPVGQYVFVSKCRLYHPNVEFSEQTFQFGGSGDVLCLTSGDFVTSPTHIPKGAIVDMELAYIAAFGFRKITAIKYISDKFNLKQYEDTCRTSSLNPSAKGTPAAGNGPALSTDAGRGAH